MTPTCKVTSYTAYYNPDRINYNNKEVEITLILEKAVVYLNGDATIITKIDNSTTEETQSNRTYTRDYNSSGYTIIPFVYCDTIAGTGTMVVNDYIGTKLTYSGVGVTNGNTFIDGGTYTVTVSVDDPNFTFCEKVENKPNTFTVKINSVYVVLNYSYNYSYSILGITQNADADVSDDRIDYSLNIDDVLNTSFATEILKNSDFIDWFKKHITQKQSLIKITVNSITIDKLSTIIIAENTSLNRPETVNSGVTLLVPYDSTYKISEETQDYTTQETATLSVYKKLTINSMLTVKGTLNVSGLQYQTSGAYTGFTTGNYGLIEMTKDSNIQVIESGKLISFGFIKNRNINSDDVGSITLSEGAIAYEPLRISDWTGGQIANAVKDKFFPFSQFYIGNIESQLDIYAGASLNAQIAIVVSGFSMEKTVEMFGTNGLFGIESGYVTKQVVLGKINIIINENSVVNTNNISATLSAVINTVEISTSGKEIPICGFYNIIVKGTANINSRFKLLPGASIFIEENATCNINNGGALIGVINSDGSNYDYTQIYYNGTTIKYPQNTSAYASNSNVTMRNNGTMNVHGVLAGKITTTRNGSILYVYADSSLDPTIIMKCNIQKETGLISTTYELVSTDGVKFVALTNGEQIVNDSNNTVTYIGNGSYFVKT